MFHKNSKSGFTLIEVIIYIALLAFIIGAGVSSAYYLIDSSAKGNADVSTIAEAEFLMRKIDWALTGAETFDLSVSGIIGINKYDTTFNPIQIKWNETSSSTEISVGTPEDFLRLTSERVKVTGLEFVALSPEGVTASTTIDGKHFEITKYLRQ